METVNAWPRLTTQVSLTAQRLDLLTTITADKLRVSSFVFRGITLSLILKTQDSKLETNFGEDDGT